MPPALWGSLTALGWGSADFLSRFTGGRLGVLTALAGMMGSSFLLLSLYAWQSGMVIALPERGWPALLGAAAGIVVGTLLLYWGLVRGPISLVAPIVGAYPVWNLAIAIAEGVAPSLTQWLAMVAVIGGVAVVARLGGGADAKAEAAPGGVPATVVIALASSLSLALGIASAHTAGPLFGELQLLLAIRLFGTLLTLTLLALMPRVRRPVPWRWWPVLGLQGLLDAGAYLALFAGSRSAEGAHSALVVASAFAAVTVVLAWAILRERIVAGQWLAILVIVIGVGVLTAL